MRIRFWISLAFAIIGACLLVVALVMLFALLLLGTFRIPMSAWAISIGSCVAGPLFVSLAVVTRRRKPDGKLELSKWFFGTAGLTTLVLTMVPLGYAFTIGGPGWGWDKGTLFYSSIVSLAGMYILTAAVLAVLSRTRRKGIEKRGVR